MLDRQLSWNTGRGEWLNLTGCLCFNKDLPLKALTTFFNVTTVTCFYCLLLLGSFLNS